MFIGYLLKRHERHLQKQQQKDTQLISQSGFPTYRFVQSACIQTPTQTIKRRVTGANKLKHRRGLGMRGKI